MTTPFGPATDAWFREALGTPTAIQSTGWPVIREGRHALLIAPTGSGKTLAAFLDALDRRMEEQPPESPPESAREWAPDPECTGAEITPGYRVLYVSPLKALAADVERNLRAPLTGITHTAARQGRPVATPRVDIRTGDTPQTERRRQAREPGDILVTTPESLYLLLGSRAGATLETVDTVIVDEVHALAGSKRGAHLALSLERLSERCARDPQRIGLSATVHPVEVAQQFLGGDREVEVVDAAEPPRLDLEIVTPEETASASDPGTPASDPNETDDKTRSAAPRIAGGSLLGQAWQQGAGRQATGSPPVTGPQGGRAASLEPRLLEAILAHRSTIVFVNSRGLCERLVQRINEAWRERCDEDNPEDLVAAHHGSVSHGRRAEIEGRLKTGHLRGIIATSSLELGIDMGAVDLVVMVESPGAVSRGLQRAGRAGHGVGQVSRSLMLPRYRGDLLECAVIGQRMHAGALEPLQMPRRPLDVLAQQLVAMVCEQPRTVDELHAVVTRAAPWRDLGRGLLEATLDMLAGNLPGTELADLRPWLAWDRARDELTPRRGAAMAARLNAGTIPDRGLYAVHAGQGGPRIGELDEEMVFELKTGENLTLGASTWHVEAITRDRVLVSPAPGEAGKLPFWHGDGPGRPVELGRAIGAAAETLARLEPAARSDWLCRNAPLSPAAADELAEYIGEQMEAAGAVPSDRRIVVERFRDELGDWRVCILSPFGARVHAPWAMALQAELSVSAEGEAQVMYTDDGIVLRLADREDLPEPATLFPDPDTVEELVTREAAGSSRFAALFRENAARALLLVRNRPGQRTPLWAQRLKAQQLLATVQQHAQFPVVLETYRQLLADVFDMEALRDLLGRVQQREIRVHEVETPRASPFARSLVSAWVAAWIYEQDAPVAERKAQALTLDRGMLAELLGQAELRELIDPGALAALEAELARTVPGTRATDPDELHDLLRRLGDRSEAELAASCEAPPGPWLQQLQEGLRAVRVNIGGEPRWIAAEDAALYRDAAGVVPPPGLPGGFLEPPARPLEQLLIRYARNRGPFRAEQPASRYGLPEAAVRPVLEALEAAGRLLRGAIRPGGHGEEWCDTDALRRLKRRTLAQLREEAAAVDAGTLGRFLPQWQGVTEPGRGTEALHEVLAQLEGIALPWSAWTGQVLPMRLQDFSLEQLDLATATGAFVWVGCGALGQRDGRVMFLRREQAGALLEPAAAAPDANAGPDASAEDGDSGSNGDIEARLRRAILDALDRRGACFYMELERAAREAVPEAPAAAIEAALWDCVWSGLITNDTVAPLRGLGQRGRSAATRGRRGPGRGAGRGAGRGPGRGQAGIAGGRWSRVSDLVDPTIEITERARDRTEVLLARYGVVSREMARAEESPGGFGRIYPVCRAMEDAGKLRRGHFVEGLTGAQFARAGVVDRLRSLECSGPGASEASEAGEVCWLAAVDPAQPWGALLAWPEPPPGAQRRLRRVAGALVALVDGRPAIYLTASGRQLFIWPADVTRIEPADWEDRIVAALRGLMAGPWLPRRRGVTVEQINDQPARQSPWAEPLQTAGARGEVRGLRLEPTRPVR
ncbi:DEAD/DEAH box helicase [Thioalkalivibrio sp. ALE19]|uniref:Lhr family helicase n=1 Tax=Thioalkalivibrio sp. ALE19 TaxID=1266909 RepID=UPI0004275586|nr:DEAD/DEAH box helicase [Thioalkalivibrio sp. ALE19]